MNYDITNYENITDDSTSDNCICLMRIHVLLHLYLTLSLYIKAKELHMMKDVLDTQINSTKNQFWER